LIWDNIFANDYIPGKILRFPYRNRTPTIINKIKGILINPMNNYLQSKPLIYTAAEYFKDPENYDPVKAWQNATVNHKFGSPHSP
jgi:hyaluronoglucosaminidase